MKTRNFNLDPNVTSSREFKDIKTSSQIQNSNSKHYTNYSNLNIKTNSSDKKSDNQPKSTKNTKDIIDYYSNSKQSNSTLNLIYCLFVIIWLITFN